MQKLKIKRLRSAQLEDEVNLQEKNKVNIDSLKKFIKNNKLILKPHQRFRSEKL